MSNADSHKQRSENEEVIRTSNNARPFVEDAGDQTDLEALKKRIPSNKSEPAFRKERRSVENASRGFKAGSQRYIASNTYALLSVLAASVGMFLVYQTSTSPVLCAAIAVGTALTVGLFALLNNRAPKPASLSQAALRARFEALEDKAWELRESEERYRTLAEAFGDVLILRDRFGTITYVNDAYDHLVGGDTATAQTGRALDVQIMEKLDEKISSSDVSDKFAADFQASQTKDKVISIETQSGTRWLQWIDLPVRDEKNGGTGKLSVARDITTFKRTSEFEANARERAEQASNAKSKFLAMVSHEMRTPLNGIIGMSKLLLETRQTGEQQNYTHALENSGQNLLGLIEGMLDLTMIEGGKFSLKPSVFDIRDLLNESAELLAQRAYEKNIGFGLVVSSNVPEKITSDAGRLRQIIFNLAGNAIKFTSKGGVQIKVSMQSEPIASEQGASSFLVISVIDTGPGLAISDKDRIFEEFERVDDEVTRKTDGAGLGLSISRALIGQLGGEINLLKSDPAGSVFEVRLELEGQEGSSPTASCERSLAGQSVLMITNNEVEAQCIQEIVCSKGGTFQILKMDKMEEDDFEYIDQTFHHVLFDPSDSKNTKQAMQRVRTRFGNSIIHIVLAPNEKPKVETYLSYGADAWLTRPVRETSLQSNLLQREVTKNPVNLDVRHLDVRQSDVVSEPADAVTPLLNKDGRQTRVLLAEDNDVNALLVSAALQKIGIKVERANNGQEAISLFENKSAEFDLVLMDLHMPVMDGTTAIAAIRNLEQQSSKSVETLPIFALSADEQEENQKAVLSAGANGFLSKPLDPADLKRLVFQVMNPDQGAAEID